MTRCEVGLFELGGGRETIETRYDCCDERKQN